jgi:restriction system protein
MSVRFPFLPGWTRREGGFVQNREVTIPGKIPPFTRFVNPLLRALRAIGGSGSIDEIYDKVVELEKVPEDVLSKLHDPDKSNQTEVAYRLA